MPTLLSKILRYLKKTERHIRTGKSDDILKQVMINVNPMIWFKSCNTNLLIIIIIINKNINGSQSPKSKFIVQHTFNMFKKAFYYI